MFLSAVMMLEHVGEVEKARRIREAIAAVVKEGKVRTYDMMRIPGGANAIRQGAASTGQMTDAVLAQIALRPAMSEAQELAGAITDR
jgi:3-isopropylmalate dehydrogenase